MQPTQTTTPPDDQAAALHKLAAETVAATDLLTRARGGWVPPNVLAACCERLLTARHAGALRTLEDQVYVVGRAALMMDTFNAASLESLASQSRAADPGLVLRAAALMLHLHQHSDDPAGWPLQTETADCAIQLADWLLLRLRPTLPAPMLPEERVRVANAQPAASDTVVANLPPPQPTPANAEDSGSRSSQAERLEALLGVLTQYAADHPEAPTPTLRTLARSHGFSQHELGALAKAYPERLQLDAKPTTPRGGRPSPTLRTHDVPATLP